MQAARGAPLTGDRSVPDGDPAGSGSAGAEPGNLGPDEAGSPDAGTSRIGSSDGGTPVGPLPPRRRGLLAAVAAAALVADVATKVLVVERLEGRDPVELLGGALRLDVSRNPGAAFSLGQDATLLLTAVALAVVVVILVSARRLRSAGWAVALGLLLGGASGNLVDRLLRAPGPGRGEVVDFIDFRVWPVFNLADSAIVVGGVLAVLLSIRGAELDGTRKDQAQADP